MDTTPAISRFDEFYRTTTPPWVIGEPQPALVDLERTGLISGKVLDVGCGTGEHTILLARLGYDVRGIDFAPEAIEKARRNADANGVPARFEVADAMNLADQPQYDTIVDSALFHIFDDTDRPKYVASLRNACRPGGVVHVLALSEAGRGFGPQVSGETIRDAFSHGWKLEDLQPTTYRGVVTEVHTQQIGLPIGTRVDEPAWLATVRRV
jgi:2-polyprenyl-3-methyl-5-hydroxy-6-metoxy-1,4-benzoquinol methylase